MKKLSQNHPNIVKFQEVFMTRKGRLCIVMDYCDGGDVYQYIKRRKNGLSQVAGGVSRNFRTDGEVER